MPKPEDHVEDVDSLAVVVLDVVDGVGQRVQRNQGPSSTNPG